MYKKANYLCFPDAPNVSLFVFQGNVNRAIGKTDVGTITGEVLQAKDGRWTVEDPNLELKIGDVINYYVVVSADRAGYVKDNLSHTVTGMFLVNLIIKPLIFAVMKLGAPLSGLGCNSGSVRT